MSNTKFTSGDWKGDYFVVKSNDRVVADCGVSYELHDKEAAANVHLIATAPDMYAMLEDSRTMLRAFYANTGSMGAIAQVRFIDELLKKARGE